MTFNPIRNKRLSETKKYILKEELFDIGSGYFPLTNNCIKIDSQFNTKPNINCNIINLPIQNKSLNQVSCCEIIEHFKYKEQLLIIKELYRIMKPNARLIITIPNSSSFMKIPQQIVWFIREHTTQRNYYNNGFTDGHIGLISPEKLCLLLINNGFLVIIKRRLMLYDYIIIATKINN